MLRWSDSTTDGERGSAPLEFIGVGLVLLVPLVYLVLMLGAIQHQTLGVEAAARHIARTIATAPDAASAAARAEAVLASISREYGIDPETIRVEVDCVPAVPTCPGPDTTLHVHVAARVPLALVPPLLGIDRAASVPVEASAPQRLSTNWGSR